MVYESVRVFFFKVTVLFMCICTIRIAYMYVYSSILFRCIYLFIAAFFPRFKTFHCSSNISRMCVFPHPSLFKNRLLCSSRRFFTFFQEMYSNYSLCQLTPRIKAFKSLCVITIMCRNNLGHH